MQAMAKGKAPNPNCDCGILHKIIVLDWFKVPKPHDYGVYPKREIA
jgi:hypothetical protein